jgi:hypothetical protein
LSLSISNGIYSRNCHQRNSMIQFRSCNDWCWQRIALMGGDEDELEMIEPENNESQKFNNHVQREHCQGVRQANELSMRD